MKNMFLLQDGIVLLFDILIIEIHFALLFILVLIAAAIDLKSRKIPNWLVSIALVSSLLYQTFSGYGLTFWITGLGVGFLSFFPLYLVRAMGAGDVKLMAAVGSFVGGVAAFQTVVLALLAGGAMALLVMVWNRNWKLVFQNINLMATNMTITAMSRELPKAEAPVKSAGNLPYGVAIAAGTLLYIVFFRP